MTREQIELESEIIQAAHALGGTYKGSNRIVWPNGSEVSIDHTGKVASAQAGSCTAMVTEILHALSNTTQKI